MTKKIIIDLWDGMAERLVYNVVSRRLAHSVGNTILRVLFHREANTKDTLSATIQTIDSDSKSIIMTHINGVRVETYGVNLDDFLDYDSLKNRDNIGSIHQAFLDVNDEEIIEKRCFVFADEDGSYLIGSSLEFVWNPKSPDDDKIGEWILHKVH